MTEKDTFDVTVPQVIEPPLPRVWHLSAAVIAQVVGGLRSGLSLKSALSAIGLDERKHFEYLRRAEEADQKEESLLSARERLYLLYRSEINKAQTEFKKREVGVIVASPDWKAHWKILEAYFPEEFSSDPNMRIPYLKEVVDEAKRQGRDLTALFKTIYNLLIKEAEAQEKENEKQTESTPLTNDEPPTPHVEIGELVNES